MKTDNKTITITRDEFRKKMIEASVKVTEDLKEGTKDDPALQIIFALRDTALIHKIEDYVFDGEEDGTNKNDSEVAETVDCQA